MVESSSLTEEGYREIIEAFRADHPAVIACPKALLAHLHQMDTVIGRQMTAAGHLITDQIEEMCALFLALSRFFKKEFGHLPAEL